MNKYIYKILLSLLIFNCALYAQPPVSHIDPGREGKNFIEAHTFNKFKKRSLSKISPQNRNMQRGQISKIKFPLCEVVFKDVSIYRKGVLQKQFCPYVGGITDLDKLYEISNILTNQYRGDGYILSSVLLPPQKMQNGSVKMQVAEGCVGMVFVEAKSLSKSTKKLIEGYGENIAKSCPLHVNQLEHYILLANDIPGVHVQTYVKPSAKIDHASDLHMVVYRKKVDLSVTVSNDIPRKYGDLSFTVGSFINDIYKGSRTGISVRFASNLDRLQLYNFTHAQILNNRGMTLNITGQYVKNQPVINGGLPVNYDIYGNSYLLSANLIYPVNRTRQSSFTLHATFDGVRSFSRTKLMGLEIQRMHDKIYSLRVGSNFEYLDKLLGSNLLSLELSQGLSVFDYTKKSDVINKSRQGGRGDYTKLNLDFSRLQYLPGNFSFLVMTEGQYSFHELLSAEEFGVGGSQLGRGYDQSEVVGEHGIAAAFELRHQNSWLKYIDQMQFYTFFDTGKVWNVSGGKTIDTDQTRTAYLSSCGLGVRFYFRKNFIGKMELAKPINKSIVLRNTDPKFLFTMQFIA